MRFGVLVATVMMIGTEPADAAYVIVVGSSASVNYNWLVPAGRLIVDVTSDKRFADLSVIMESQAYQKAVGSSYDDLLDSTFHPTPTPIRDGYRDRFGLPSYTPGTVFTCTWTRHNLHIYGEFDGSEAGSYQLALTFLPAAVLEPGTWQ